MVWHSLENLTHVPLSRTTGTADASTASSSSPGRIRRRAANVHHLTRSTTTGGIAANGWREVCGFERVKLDMFAQGYAYGKPTRAAEVFGSKYRALHLSVS